MLHTITDYKYEFRRSDGRKVNVGLIHEIIGESIPPRGLELIFAHLTQMLLGRSVERRAAIGQTQELALHETAKDLAAAR